MASERVRRARRRRRRHDLAVSPGGRPADDSPVGTPGGKQNWVDKAGGLPKYIREIAHALIRKGRTESEAIRLAVGAVRNFAAGHDGHGHKVSAKVQAAASAALAEWEAKKASGKATPNKGRHDMSNTPAAPAKGKQPAKKKPAPQPAPTGSSSGFDSAKHPRGAKGTPTGGRFVSIGKARDAQGAQAQKSKVGNEAYRHEIVASAAVRNKRLTRLNDAQLAALSRTAYSFKSNDPGVVKLRMAIAREMAKRGYDVKDFGAKGGGINSDKKLPPSDPSKVGRSNTAKALAYTARHGTPAEKARALAKLRKAAGKKAAK
jgi:hypothetical protein